MKRVDPTACIPKFKVTVTPGAPRVHETASAFGATSSAAVLFVTTGSYAPKFNGVGLVTVHFAITVAETAMLVV